jgi:hypothetical protein
MQLGEHFMNIFCDLRNILWLAVGVEKLQRLFRYLLSLYTHTRTSNNVQNCGSID